MQTTWTVASIKAVEEHLDGAAPSVFFSSFIGIKVEGFVVSSFVGIKVDEVVDFIFTLPMVHVAGFQKVSSRTCCGPPPMPPMLCAAASMRFNLSMAGCSCADSGRKGSHGSL